MNLPPLKLTVLDTETTGFVPRVHRVIEFASIRLDNGKVMEEYEELFFTEAVPPIVEVLTRIRTGDLNGKARMEDRSERILQAIGPDTIIVGQNTGFDLGMLKGHGIDLTDRPWIDTSMLASLVFPELESYSLGYLSTVLNLTHEPKHRAMGDVRATLELLEKCWERFLELPEELLKPMREIMEKSSPGNRALFAALPQSTITKRPKWLDALKTPLKADDDAFTVTADLSPPKAEEILLVEEPLDPKFLHGVLSHALASGHRHLIAVKNLEASLTRLPPLKDLSVIYPPFLLVDEDAKKALLAQEQFTADESTLAAKLHWYDPTTRAEFPLHGGEEAVWSGKLACTRESKTYLQQFKKLTKVVLCDHRQLLSLLREPIDETKNLFTDDLHVMIDDASMLEDTATKAFGDEVSIDALRAAVQGNDALTKFTDLLQLWIEQVRNGQDLRYIAPSDLGQPTTKGLREQLSDLVKEKWPLQTKNHLESLTRFLTPENLDGSITYIETRQNGSQYLHSAPSDVGLMLKKLLFDQFPTTLFVPPGLEKSLREVLPTSVTTKIRSGGASDSLQIDFAAEPSLDSHVASIPDGKTIILIPSKGIIENLFVKYAEQYEEAGATLICQGLSGGQGRMQAEFLASKSPVVWCITPWTFEGIDLPKDSVDHLVISALPFDHPNNAILSRRSEKYQNAFGDYNLPRLMHRLFRLMRTFARMKTKSGDVRVLDERIGTKAYGEKIKAYLSQFVGDAKEDVIETTPEKKESEKNTMAKKSSTANAGTLRQAQRDTARSRKKKNEEQMGMF